MGLEIMLFLRATHGPSAWLMICFFLGKSQETGRTMISSTNRSINCKLITKPDFNPASIPVCPSAMDQLPWMFHEHLKLTTPKIVTFSLLVTTPTVFLNVSSTSQTYILPQEVVKILIQKVRGVAQDYISDCPSHCLCCWSRTTLSGKVVRCPLPALLTALVQARISAVGMHLMSPCSSSCILQYLPQLPKWPY